MRYIGLAFLFAFLTDQLSKLWVMFGLDMQVGERLDILPPLLVFKFGWNDGINFGLFGGNPDGARWVLIALALVISAALLWWARKSITRPIALIGVGLIVGGALANALDRVLYGAVADFLNMSCCGINNPFIFNIADIWIFAGAFAIVIFDEKKDGANTA
ncbi:MAG: signal peptidase II [Litoreibacter sp.]|nr:signal peptidase II [Litoreibacter sp.]MCY4335904.1 signal peptidase II [Litoreibacter sp.]